MTDGWRGERPLCRCECGGHTTSTDAASNIDERVRSGLDIGQGFGGICQAQPTSDRLQEPLARVDEQPLPAGLTQRGGCPLFSFQFKDSSPTNRRNRPPENTHHRTRTAVSTYSTHHHTTGFAQRDENHGLDLRAARRPRIGGGRCRPTPHAARRGRAHDPAQQQPQPQLVQVRTNDRRVGKGHTQGGVWFEHCHVDATALHTPLL